MDAAARGLVPAPSVTWQYPRSHRPFRMKILSTLYDYLTATASIVVTVHDHRIALIAMSSQEAPRPII